MAGGRSLWGDGFFSFGFLKDSKTQTMNCNIRPSDHFSPGELKEGGGGAMEGGRSPHLRNCQSVSGLTQSATGCRYSQLLLGSDLGFDIFCV